MEDFFRIAVYIIAFIIFIVVRINREKKKKEARRAAQQSRDQAATPSTQTASPSSERGDGHAEPSRGTDSIDDIFRQFVDTMENANSSTPETPPEPVSTAPSDDEIKRRIQNTSHRATEGEASPVEAGVDFAKMDDTENQLVDLDSDDEDAPSGRAIDFDFVLRDAILSKVVLDRKYH